MAVQYHKITNLFFEPQGVHDPQEAYSIMDVVTSEDGSTVYAALQDVPAGTALDDASYWRKVMDVSETKKAMDDSLTMFNGNAESLTLRVRGEVVSAEGNPVAFTPDAGSAYVPITHFGPVQEGEGEASDTNIRAITPRTALSMTLKGYNLFDSSFVTNRTQAGIKTARQADGRIKLTGTLSGTTLTRAIKSVSEAFMTLPPGTYTLRPSNFSLRYLGGTSGITQYYNSGTFTLEEERTYVNAIWTLEEGVTYDELVEIQLEVGSKPTAYCPFSLDFAQELGDGVIGGDFNWRTGMLTGNWNMVELTGGDSEKWTAAWDAPVNGRLRINGSISNTPRATGNTCVCSHRESGEPNESDCWVTNQSDANKLYVRFVSAWATLDESIAWLEAQAAAGTPVQVAYPCEGIPTETQLTGTAFTAYDASKEHSLSGDESIEVQYVEPLVATIEKHTAPLIARLEALEAAAASAQAVADEVVPAETVQDEIE